MNITRDEYHAMYARSISNPEEFWREQANKFVTWFKPYTKTLQGDFKTLDIEWFINGKLNACYNCIDRHLPQRANQVALFWEGNEIHESKKITYQELYEQVCRFANVLKKYGIKKGDRVCIYLPVIAEVIVAMLACARIGAIHSVVFGGFSPDSIKNRILDADCCLVITANEGLRGNKTIPLKANVDTALLSCPQVKNVMVIQRTQTQISWNQTRDHWYHEEILTVAADCPCEEMDAEDPLYILYTSGSTGKPKGILHTTGGYLVYVTSTFHYVFDYQEGDVYWCAADVGWVTGHSYMVYGPLSSGATSVIFEGIPTYPTPARYWNIVDKYAVNILYTSPTAIRALRHDGDDWVTKSNRKSLRLLGTVGEPINPAVWEWYYQVVGNGQCPIVDTWWQTETGGIMLTPLPGATPLKPGATSWPFLGIRPNIVDEYGKPMPTNTLGKLVITQPWPGMMKTIYGDPNKFFDAYFKEYPGNYLTGDDASCDAQGYYWIAGRNDDVLKISGHRIGTAEVESAFLTHPDVAEAAVVTVPHAIKGEAIYAFVSLRGSQVGSNELKKVLTLKVRDVIGAIASPDYIQWANELPKTRSGKIMRRLLRKIANNDLDTLGDTSTLADPLVVDKLIAGRLIQKEKTL